ncbi:MAG: LUD domain-containing protein [Deltaproteobacteria bacterium]|jgi:L-lactate dehydrogenase complex protein LldG|nr:LUD domain-containing protein [Deltaproteobacteria bacterium]
MSNVEGQPSLSATSEFMKKAQAVSTITVEVKGLRGALDYLLKVTSQAAPASLLPTKSSEFAQGPNQDQKQDFGGAQNQDLGQAQKQAPAGAPEQASGQVNDLTSPRKKLMAVPGLSQEDLAYLEKKASELGFGLIRGGLRERLAGFEVAFSVAAFGIAETATCVLENESEDSRLAGMLAETHVVALDKKNLFETSREALGVLEKALERPANFVSFISGPSRTSDIERVLSLGVHGPFHFHVALMD